MHAKTFEFINFLGSRVCVSVCLCVWLTAGERRHSAGSVALPARTNPAGAEEAAALQMTPVASDFFSCCGVEYLKKIGVPISSVTAT